MTFEPQPPIVVYRSTNAKIVRERALVLNAMGISSQVRGQGGEHYLLVPHEQAEAATEELASYSSENVDWPPRYEAPALAFEWPPRRRALRSDPLGLLSLGQHGAFGVNIWDPGKMHVGKLFSGEWWRVFTPLTLHADVSHLGGNLLSGIAFGILCAQLMGSGLAWLSIVLAGALGNLLSSSLQPAATKPSEPPPRSSRPSASCRPSSGCGAIPCDTRPCAAWRPWRAA